ncbi:unnamed protein product [Effrenium voratum]|nr:unnamed protein product [Effrenium voratum]
MDPAKRAEDLAIGADDRRLQGGNTRKGALILRGQAVGAFDFARASVIHTSGVAACLPPDFGPSEAHLSQMGEAGWVPCTKSSGRRTPGGSTQRVEATLAWRQSVGLRDFAGSVH